MPIKPENTDKITSLLSSYDVDSDDIAIALQFDQDIESWKNYIKENISLDNRSIFIEQLNNIFLGVQSLHEKGTNIDPSAKFASELFNIYCKIQPIHINLQKIVSTPLQESKWSDELISEIEITLKNQVTDVFKNSSMIEDFFKQTVDRIYDLIARRVDLVSYFKIVQNISEKFSTQAAKILSKIHLNDFVILFLKFISDKDVVGKLLSQIGIALPLFYTVNDQLQYYPDLLKNILSTGTQHLILNIGTPGARKCGKSKLLSQIFSLNKKHDFDSHFPNTLNFYTQFAFSLKEKAILADFNGQINDSTPGQLEDKLLLVSQRASLIILHVSETQIDKQNKIMPLTNPFYAKILSQAEKVVLIIRDASKVIEKKIFKALPENIKDKTLIYLLENLTVDQRDLQNESVKLTEYLFQKESNILTQRKFKYSSISTDEYQNKIQKYGIMVDDLVKDLYDVKYNKKTILPGVSLEEQIYEKFQELKSIQRKQSETHAEYLDRYNMADGKHKSLEELQKIIKLSDFCKKGINILQQKQRDCNELMIEGITQWKNSKLFPLKNEFIELTNQLHEIKKGQHGEQQIKKKIQKIIEKMSEYQISIDSLINQIMIQNEKVKSPKLKQLISTYYSESYKRMSPINIVEGKTLKFGNSQLKSFFQQLNQIYAKTNKKIYVISVIGAQSSAKSTLLNMLFRCSFETSAGRCTKGVYFSVCEIQDMVIVILDTQGLLSVSARDAAFDNQIATFVLKVSNLIIINNKGELTSTLKQLLKVCMYVLECLHKDDEKGSYTPQKIMFTLRDQIKPEGKFQEQMVAQIKNELESVKNKQSINYKNFFSIETQDIFSLPNVFEEAAGLSGQSGSYKTYYPVFGKCILALRNRIIKLLRQSAPQQNLASFYALASSCWNTIQKCGQNIINFKSINQIIVKTRLAEILQANTERYRKQIQVKYDKFMNKIANFNSQDLANDLIRNQLVQIFQKNKKDLTSDFSNLAGEQCTSKTWIKDMFPKIYDICASYSICYNQELTKTIKQKQNSQKTHQVEEKLKNIVINLLNNASNDEMIQTQFKAQTNSLIQSYGKIKNQYQDNKNKSLFQINIKLTFDSLLKSQKQSTLLKITNVQDCFANHREIVDHFTDFNQWAPKIFIFIFMNYGQKLLNQNDVFHISKFVSKCFKNLEDEIQRNIIRSKILKTSQIQSNFRNWLNLMERELDQLEKEIINFTSSWRFARMWIQKSMMRSVLFGLIFKVTFKKLYSNNLNIISEKQAEVQALINRTHEQLKNALKFRGQINDTLDLWTNKLVDRISTTLNSICLQKVKSSLLKIRTNLDPEKILAKGIANSLASKTDDKKKWRQCFKIIKNINKYLFEIMCEEDEIKTRKALIAENINQTKQQSIKQIDSIILALTNINFSDIQAVSNYLNQNNLIYVENKSFTKAVILKSFLEKLENEKHNILTKIKDKINQQAMQQAVQSYIKNQLKRKVIGCRHTCPMCGMKCKKQRDHSDNQHQVMKGSHIMSAFSGMKISQTYYPCYDVCYTKDLLSSGKIRGEQLFKTTKELIRQKHPEWDNHFPQVDQVHLMQGDYEKMTYAKIWANLEDIFIKQMYPYMNPDGKYNNLRSDPLTDADLDLVYENYKGQKVTLRKQYF